MTVRERILSIRLSEHISHQQTYADQIGITVKGTNICSLEQETLQKRKERTMGRKNRNFDDYDQYGYSDREEQEYYDRHPSEVPDGCSACGGPFPSCCDSCPMFDD